MPKCLCNIWCAVAGGIWLVISISFVLFSSRHDSCSSHPADFISPAKRASEAQQLPKVSKEQYSQESLLYFLQFTHPENAMALPYMLHSFLGKNRDYCFFPPSSQGQESSSLSPFNYGTPKQRHEALQHQWCNALENEWDCLQVPRQKDQDNLA